MSRGSQIVRPMTERYANVEFWQENLAHLLFYQSGRGFGQIPWIDLKDTTQVLGIPCFGKSIDVQWCLFQQSPFYENWVFLIIL